MPADPATDAPAAPDAGGAADPALAALRRLTANPAATFREHQREAIADLVDDRARVLCVERTGWGKSAVYFVATRLLRDAGAGPTLIVSPLLALMRNQLAAAERLGLRAHRIDSTNRDAWSAVREHLAADDVDLLLISPERLNNPGFRRDVLPLFADRVGLLVVDEAHCVSDWGHDFRPDYRRVRDMVARLPEAVAVLGTTATANDRVVADVVEQLGTRAPATDGPDPAPSGEAREAAGLRVYRGPLDRESLRLEVVDLPRLSDRLAWLVQTLPRLEGSGIVYALTVRDAEVAAAWLQEHGIAARAYSGQAEGDAREAAERALLHGEVKALVATSALGMGYDKPDLGFVVHLQSPGSVIAYYQQVGRAGRALEHADAILLRGSEDRRIQDFFIEQAFPSRERVEEVLTVLGASDEGLTAREVGATVNLGLTRLEAMLKVLDVEGAVERDGTRWRVVPGSGWAYDGRRYAEVTAVRRREQEAMSRLGTDGRCLMRTLLEELDDVGAGGDAADRITDCGRCAVCTGPRFQDPPDPALAERAARHLRARPQEFAEKRMAPDAEGRLRKLAEDVRTLPGLALGRVGDGGWWPAVSRGLAASAFDDELALALAEAVRGHAPAVAWVTGVPAARGPLVEDLAAAVAGHLGVPVVAALHRTEARPPQREMANAAQQAANVRGAFAVTDDVPGGTGLLVDDVRGSGWTLAMVGGQLRRRGAGAVVPAALATR